MATIHLQDVSRVFGGGPLPDAVNDKEADEETALEAASSRVLALDNLTLTIPNGRTLAIVGPSGCGKSTLLRVIAGLDRSYSGGVFYDGRDMADVPPRERYMGMVFQGYALYPHFHGYNNLRFTFLVRKAPDEEAAERIRITSDMMGYGFRQLLGRKPGTLSGGEQQRLALARALVRKPDVLLLDEPLSNLDAQLRVKTRVEMKRLLRQFNITTVYVTHDQTEAISLADSIAVMRDGRIEQVGTYEQIRSRPVNTFVAGFVGIHPLNLLPARVMDAGAVSIGNMTLRAPQGLNLTYRVGKMVTAGITTEDLLVEPSYGNHASEGTIEGRVLVIEPDFARKLEYVRVETHLGIITATAQLGTPLSFGQTVSIGSSGSRVQLFSSNDGHNLLLTV